MRPFLALLCLAACGPALPTFTEGDPCDCRRDLGLEGQTPSGAPLVCRALTGTSASGTTFHFNRCAMLAPAP